MTPEEENEIVERALAARDADPAYQEEARRRSEEAELNLIEEASEYAKAGVDPFDDPNDEIRADKLARGFSANWPTLTDDQLLVMARLWLLGRKVEATRYATDMQLLANPNRRRRIQDLEEGETW